MRRSFTSKVKPTPASKAAKANTTKNIDFNVRALRTPKNSKTQTIPASTSTKVLRRCVKE